MESPAEAAQSGSWSRFETARGAKVLWFRAFRGEDREGPHLDETSDSYILLRIGTLLKVVPGEELPPRRSDEPRGRCRRGRSATTRVLPYLLL